MSGAVRGGEGWGRGEGRGSGPRAQPGEGGLRWGFGTGGPRQAWHPPPSWAMAEANQTLGLKHSPAVQHSQPQEARCLLGMLELPDMLPLTPPRSAMFSWVLGAQAGALARRLSRGHSVVVESGVWSAPG